MGKFSASLQSLMPGAGEMPVIPDVKTANRIAFEQWEKGQSLFRLTALNFRLERLPRHLRAISRDQDRSDQLCIEIGLQ